MAEENTLRLVLDRGSVTIHGVSGNRPIRRLLHDCGFRPHGADGYWELPSLLPPAMRTARLAEVIRILGVAQVPLVIEDLRPAPVNVRENRARLAEVYSGQWRFGEGHQPYVLAVAATAQVRGMRVSDITVQQGLLVEDPVAPAGIRVSARAAAVELADGRAVAWDESAGWCDTATGQPLPISQIADPATVVTEIAALPSPSTVVTGRDPSQVDPRFEQALAVYRQHPGAEALTVAGAIDGHGPYQLMPNDVRAIQQWTPPAPPPDRWQDVALLSAGTPDRVASAWPSRRSPTTAYRTAAPAALRHLRQSRLARQRHNEVGDQK